jgi:hypothetical protein
LGDDFVTWSVILPNSAKVFSRPAIENDRIESGNRGFHINLNKALLRPEPVKPLQPELNAG